jgi:parallel beta-helix repeat protein
MKQIARVAIAVFAVSTAAVAQGATIIVPDDNTSVRDAVANAGAGDVVQVRPGTYNESVRIENGQTGLVVEGLGGVPTIAPSRSDDAFRIKRVDGVTLRGLAIESTRRGVRADEASGLTLEDLAIHGGVSDAIRIKGGSGNTVTGGDISSVGGRGVRVDKSPNAAVGDTSIIGAKREGILVKVSSGASVAGNNGSANGSGGIRLIKCPDSTVDANDFPGNGNDGIRVQTSTNLTITNNTALGNVRYGIRVQKSPPIASVADLIAAGNSGGGGQFRQHPARRLATSARP